MIPKIFHFIYLFGPETVPFNINHYISIKSNIVVNKPILTNITTNDPKKLMECEWFTKLTNEFDINIILVDWDRTNHLKKMNIPHMAHRADVIRLDIMVRMGGIYSDVDSIAVNPLPEEWFKTRNAYFCFENCEDKPLAICNGFFVSAPGHTFLRDCLDVYSDYDHTKCRPGTPDWTRYSVRAAMDLYLKYGETSRYKDLKMLEPKTFQPFYLNYEDVGDLFLLDRLKDVEEGDVYQVHLWENRNQGIMKVLDERYFEESDSTYAQLGRKYL